MLDRLSLGIVPAEEPCTQVGTPNYRAKALADQLRKLGAEVHPCAKLTKPSERADFVKLEFRSHRAKRSRRTTRAASSSA